MRVTQGATAIPTPSTHPPMTTRTAAPRRALRLGGTICEGVYPLGRKKLLERSRQGSVSQSNSVSLKVGRECFMPSILKSTHAASLPSTVGRPRRSARAVVRIPRILGAFESMPTSSFHTRIGRRRTPCRLRSSACSTYAIRRRMVLTVLILLRRLPGLGNLWLTEPSRRSLRQCLRIRPQPYLPDSRRHQDDASKSFEPDELSGTVEARCS